MKNRPGLISSRFYGVAPGTGNAAAQSCGRSIVSRLPVGVLVMLCCSAGLTAVRAAEEGVNRQDERARAVIARAIEAMGGQAYLDMERISSSGNYFRFKKGAKAFSKYQDWTSFQPAKWRFQLGEGKRQYLQVYNLELNQGWVLEGKTSLEPIKEEDLDEFRRAVRQDMDILLRYRVDEEGMNLYYYSRDEVAGQGDWEAVEFLDATNDAVVVFFDRQTGLPAKLESHYTDKLGIRHKVEQLFSNWHVIQGVRMPLNYEVYTDEELSSQRFMSNVVINPAIPASHFLEPVIEEKGKKGKK